MFLFFIFILNFFIPVIQFFSASSPLAVRWFSSPSKVTSYVWVNYSRCRSLNPITYITSKAKFIHSNFRPFQIRDWLQLNIIKITFWFQQEQGSMLDILIYKHIPCNFTVFLGKLKTLLFLTSPMLPLPLRSWYLWTKLDPHKLIHSPNLITFHQSLHHSWEHSHTHPE